MSVTLVLDAMGVVFESADDVADLLQPFILTHGGEPNPERVSNLYTEASLGRLSPDDFWKSVDLNPAVEDEYLSLHRLTAGFQQFLDNQPNCVANIWCLSNDVGRWSSKLRSQFELDDFLAGAIISGDVGSRKPDPAIYHTLLSRISVDAKQVVFVDDRPKNLKPASELGLRTVQFGASTTATPPHQFSVRTFVELADLLQRID